jgi:CHAD domain-containing protein
VHDGLAASSVPGRDARASRGGNGADSGHGHVECEAKLVALPGFALPELNGVIDGIVAGLPVASELDATYYDCADLALARSGVTLRYRTGEEGPCWMLKLPGGDTATTLTRREFAFEGPADAVPSSAQDLIRGYLRSRPLQRVGRLRTQRTSVGLMNDQSQRLAEVVHDVVAAYEGTELTGTFCEVEVELAAPDKAGRKLLAATVQRLVEAGCRVETPLPKLVRALGHRAVAPSELAVPPLGETPTVAGLIQITLATSIARLISHDAGVRLGEDPEDLHQFRVATRRLRSDLRTFASVLEPDHVSTLRDELAWLGSETGRVRDDDVLGVRLREQAADLPETDAEMAVLLTRRLDSDRDHAQFSLLGMLRCERYDALLDALVSAAHNPQFGEEGLPAAHRPARGFVIKVVRRQWKRLVRAVDAAGEQPTDAELHRIRIVAKRCRYAAEAAAPVVGHRAARLAHGLAHVQDVLGDLHDTVVTEAWLREAAAAQPDCAIAAGELIARQRVDRTRLRTEWGQAWTAASAKKLHSWL